MSARAALLLLSLVLAQAARGEDAAGSVRLFCGADGTHLELAVPGAELAQVDDPTSGPMRTPARAEWIDITGLASYGRQDQHGNVLRTGSRSVLRECGRFSVRISGGYYNANPMGELGAADDYPLVEILEGTRPLAVPIAMGACDPSSARASYLAQCPDDWAARIEVYAPPRLPADQLRLELHHRYDEPRKILDPTAPGQGREQP